MRSIHAGALACALFPCAIQAQSSADTTSRRDTLATVRVTADATRPASYVTSRTRTATRTLVSLRDVPQAVTVIGRTLIADQSMQSMADVVRYIPGIQMGQGEGHRDAPTIRGNSSTADFFVDGIRDDAQYLRDLYNVERIEALKGSNAMIFGRGGGGGVINRVTKEAQWAPTRALTLEGGSFRHERAMLDFGGALSSHAAARLNAMIEDSRTFRDAELERRAVNPTFAFAAGRTMIRLGGEYFLDRRTVDRGVPSFQGRPAPAPIRRFFGDPDASRSEVDVYSTDATLERAWTERVLLRNRTRVAGYDKFYRNVYPGGTTASGSQAILNAYENIHDRRNAFNQTDLSFAVGRGWLRQTVLVGAELGHQTTDNLRHTGYFGASNTLADTVAFDDPRPTKAVSYRASASDANNRAVANVVGLYAQDQLALGSHLQAVVGLRHDRFVMDFDDHRPGSADLSRDDAMLSPRAGLVLKPVEPLSFYGTYSISYLPSSGDQFSSLTATTKTLEPERFTNREAGMKWEIRPDLVVTGAAYQLDRTNTSAPSPTNANLLVQTGKQRTTGIEAEVVGNVTSWWQVSGGYATQSARIVSRTSSAAAGARVPLVPRHTASLWNRLRATDWLGVGLGVVSQSDMFAAIDNKVTLPGFARVDGALFVGLGHGLRAQANVENVLDTRYYRTSHGNNNIMPGAPRTLRLTLTATP
ncbi:MAG TPA: TonB-dependent siderophore receptor [Gemmatimonadaceae bacterium]|nr:TonB-dependent siderophore receptor [Gemmatimonadaceae bacterium]